MAPFQHTGTFKDALLENDAFTRLVVFSSSHLCEINE